MDDNRRVFRVTLSSRDVDAFLGQCEQAQWYAMDTGERVMTDEGPDAEAVLLVEPAPEARASAKLALVH